MPAIENRIFTIRGKQVMFDRDLAKLFEVQAKAMNQAVKRNTKRFPIEIMILLDAVLFTEWKSQIVTSKRDIKGLRKRPYAFTEQGIAMLSTVISSTNAIEVSMRGYVSRGAGLAKHNQRDGIKSPAHHI